MIIILAHVLILRRHVVLQFAQLCEQLYGPRVLFLRILPGEKMRERLMFERGKEVNNRERMIDMREIRGEE